MNNDKRLYRSNTNRMIGGVCAGIGEFFGIDATVIRLLFVFGVIFGWGSMLVVYLIMLVVVPEGPGVMPPPPPAPPAPPIEPGTPTAHSKPVSPIATLRRATTGSRAAPPTRSPALVRSIVAQCSPIRITKASTPRSATNRLDPRPRTSFSHSHNSG